MAKADNSRPFRGDSEWSNRLVRADNLALLQELATTQSGQLDLVYIDPPFATGGDFAARVRVGDAGRDATVSVFRDRWAGKLSEYLDMWAERFVLIDQLLSERGALYVHLDYRAAAHVRCLLDDLYGTHRFVNEIVWFYKTGGMPDRLGFGRKHDTILYYVKDPSRAIWNPQKERSYLTHRYGFSNTEIHEDERGPYTLVNCRDVFDIPALRGNQPERVDFPTQKPEALLERILRASSNPDSVVADFCCGSGTMVVVAERLGRRWLACDVSAYAVHTTQKRLEALESLRPFSVDAQPLAPYEIQVRSRRLDSGVRIELASLKVTGEDPLPTALRGLIAHWSDRIDWWSVTRSECATVSNSGGASEGRGPAVRWSAQRSRQCRDLTLETAVLPAAVGPLTVTVADVLGHRASTEVVL